MNYGLLRRPSPMMPVGMSAPRVTAPPPANYTGNVFQQFDQAMGDQPRYVSQNAGAQRLNSMYDQSLGYGMVRRRV